MSRLKLKPTIWPSEAHPTTLGKPRSPRLTASVDRLQHIHRFHKNIQKAAPNKAGQLLSNLTHYCPTDPDARIAFKTGKPRQLSYMTSVSVDAAQHVITHIQANSADRRDSRNLLPIVDTTQDRLKRFGLVMNNVAKGARTKLISHNNEYADWVVVLIALIGIVSYRFSQADKV